jgi:uncharacterized membrane protein YgcG
MEVLPKNHFPISYNESLFPLNKANPPRERANIYVENCLYTKLRDVDFLGGFQLTQEDIQQIAEPVARDLVIEEEEDKFNKGHPVINALNKEEHLNKLMTRHFAEQIKIKKMEQRKAYKEKIIKDLEIRGLNGNPQEIERFVEDHHTQQSVKAALEAPPAVAEHVPSAEELFGQERFQQDEEAGLRLGGLDIRRNLGFAEVMAHDDVDYDPDLREAVPIDPNRSLATNLLIGLPQRGSTSGMAEVNTAGRLASRVQGYLLEGDPYDTLLGETQQRRNRVLVDFNDQLDVPIQGGAGLDFRPTIPSGTGGIRWNLVNDMGQVRDEDTLGYRKHEAKKTMGKVLSGVKEHFDKRQVAQGLVDSIIQDALLLGRQRRQVVVEESESDQELNTQADKFRRSRAVKKLQSHAQKQRPKKEALEARIRGQKYASSEMAGHLRKHANLSLQGYGGIRYDTATAPTAPKKYIEKALARYESKPTARGFKSFIDREEEVGNEYKKGRGGGGGKGRGGGGGKSGVSRGGGGGGDAEYLNAIIKGEE